MATRKTPASRAEQVARARVDEFYRQDEERIAQSKKAVVAASEAAQKYFAARSELYDAVMVIDPAITRSKLAGLIGMDEGRLSTLVRQERLLREQEPESGKTDDADDDQQDSDKTPDDQAGPEGSDNEESDSDQDSDARETTVPSYGV